MTSNVRRAWLWYGVALVLLVLAGILDVAFVALFAYGFVGDGLQALLGASLLTTLGLLASERGSFWFDRPHGATLRA